MSRFVWTSFFLGLIIALSLLFLDSAQAGGTAMLTGQEVPACLRVKQQPAQTWSAAISNPKGYTTWHVDVNHGCWYNDHEFTIDVDAKPEKINDLSLTLTAWDVDFTDPSGNCSGGPEVDKVYINNHYLGILRGASDSWSTNTFAVDPTWINGATDSQPAGTNTIRVDTDSTNTGCWCVGIGWAELRGKVGFQVQSVTPKDKADNVAWENPNISVTFDSDVDPASVNEDTFQVKGYYSGVFHGSYDVNGRTITFTPHSPLPDSGKKIKVHIRGGANGVKSKAGSGLNTDYTWSFTTMPKLTVKVIPVQVVEGVNLVPRKPTVIRVKAEWSAASDVENLVANVTLIYDEGTGHELRQELPGFTFYKKDWGSRVPGNVRRKGNAANFYLRYSGMGSVPIINEPGTSHTIKAMVEPVKQDAKPPKKFEGSTNVHVNMYRVGYTYQTINFKTRYTPLNVGGWQAGDSQNISALATANNNFLHKVYPIYRATATIDNKVIDIHPPWVTWPHGIYVKRVIQHLAETNWFGLYGNVRIGVVPHDWAHTYMEADGISANFIPGVTTYAALVADSAIATIAPHEIGHIHGLEHSDGALQGYDLTRDRYVNSQHLGLGYIGGLMEAGVADYSANMVWIDKASYSGLLSVLTASSSESMAQAQATTSVLAVSGEITREGGTETVQLNAIYILPEGTPSPNPGTGAYVLELQDASGTVLESYQFDLLFDSDGSKEIGMFVLQLPYHSHTARMVLKHGAQVLLNQSPSAHAPAVQVTSPAGGATVSGNLSIAWTGNDGDGDVLKYTVLFSGDNGDSWELLQYDLAASSTTLDTTTVANCTQCRIKVMANDGFNTSEAISNAFQIANPPAVVATYPIAGESQFDVHDTLSIRFKDAMDASSINTTTILLQDGGGGAIAGTVAYVPETQEATFVPHSALAYDTSYTARATTGVRNATGTHLPSDVAWSFRTITNTLPPGVVATSPPHMDVDIPTNPLLVAVFDKDMDAATVNQGTFTLSPVTAGQVTYNASSKTAMFIPAANLSPNTIYTATLTTAIKDTYGIALDDNYSWTFATGTQPSAGLRFTGSYADHGADNNRDGLYDWLVVDVQVEVLKDGVYNLNGKLADQQGDEIAWTTTGDSSLAVGLHTLQLMFPANTVRSHGVDGPYNLVDLHFYEVFSGTYAWLPLAYTTALYDVTKFHAVLTLTRLPDVLIPVGGSREDAFNLNDYAHHETLPDSELTYTIDINTEPRCGVSIDANDNVDIHPEPGWTGYCDVTIKVSGGGLNAWDTFRVTVAHPIPTYLPLLVKLHQAALQPTPTPTPTPTLTPTPTATPSSGGIYGRVTYGGAPAADLRLNLKQYDGTQWTVRTTTQTDANGRYSFRNQPGLGNGYFYTVEYRNTTDDPNPGEGYLWDWYGNAIDSYNAGQTKPGGDFDVKDVTLTAPSEGDSVTLPAQFCWNPRTIADDNYRLYFYSYDADEVARTDYLGNRSCITITGVPASWPSGGLVAWWVRVYQGADPANTPYNYGDSYGTRKAEIHFSATNSTQSPNLEIVK